MPKSGAILDIEVARDSPWLYNRQATLKETEMQNRLSAFAMLAQVLNRSPCPVPSLTPYREESPEPEPIIEATPPTDLGSYLTSCNRESSNVPMTCLPVQEVLEALNSQATPDNNYRGATFLYGGAPLALTLNKDPNSINDGDLMIHNGATCID